MSLLTVLPSILLMMTSFTRIIIVLSILRQAIGLQQTPPNQVLVGLVAVPLALRDAAGDRPDQRPPTRPMAPARSASRRRSRRSGTVLHGFMIRQTRETDLRMFAEHGRHARFAAPEAVPFSILLPAFVTWS